MSQSLPRDVMKTLLVACDHAGLPLKEHLLQTIPELPWKDLGTYNSESVDYPDYANLLCEQISDEFTFGVLICGSGQGMAIRANRHPHVRAALCWNEEIARIARLHNDANVLCLGARVMEPGVCEQSLMVFLNTAFEGGRHVRRVEKLWGTPLSED